MPDNVRRIDGRGRYLMPGLADLHVHVRRPHEYLGYLAHGVTTIMHLGGSASRGRALLEDRRKIEDGGQSVAVPPLGTFRIAVQLC